MADIIQLQCEVCSRINYTTFRNKKIQVNKIEKKKYCRYDRKHTLHKESK
jgi:large subunit ribosomal protein L33